MVVPRRVLAFVLAVFLLGLTPVQPAQGVVTKKWGRVLDSYGARAFACRVPVHTRSGLMWRTYVRAVNHSPVSVVASARVRRWVVAQSRTITKQTWSRTLASGQSTAVSSVNVYDTKVGEPRFFDSLWFRIRRPGDGQVLEWQSLGPLATPRCALPVSAIAWQGAGRLGSEGGRMQVCSSYLLNASGSGVFWRFRADATHASQTLNYNVRRVTVESWITEEEWSRVVPPGGYSEQGSMTQDFDFVNGHPQEDFRIGVTTSGTDTNSGIAAKNVC